MKNLILILTVAFVAISSNLTAQQEILWKNVQDRIIDPKGTIDPGDIQNVCFTPDDKNIIVSCTQKTFLVETETGKFVKELKNVNGVIRFANDGKYIYTYDGRKLNFETGEVIGTFNIKGKTPPKFFKMDISEKTGVMVGILRSGYPYTNWTKDVYVFDLATFELLDTLGDSSHFYQDFSLAQNANFFITQSEYVPDPFNSSTKSFKSRLWDSKLRKNFSDGKGIATTMTTSKDGKWIASVNSNKIRFYDAQTFEKKYETIQGGSGDLSGVAFSQDSRYFATCGNNGGNDLNDIQVRDIETGEVHYRYSNSTKGIWAQSGLLYSNNSKYLAGWSEAGIIVYNSYFETTKVDPIVNNDTLQLFPNPSSKKVSITLDATYSFTLKILNQVGKEFQVISNLANSNLANSNLEIDISTLENGTYYLVLTQNDNSKLYKFIKE